MTKSENFDPDDDYLIDDEMREIESQLRQDAERLVSLYPPTRADRLAGLIAQCQAVSSRESAEVTEACSGEGKIQSGVIGNDLEPTRVSRNQSAGSGLGRSRRWFPGKAIASAISITVVLGLLLVGNWILWSEPAHSTASFFSKLPRPSASSLSDNGTQPLVDVTPVSMRDLPAEFRNASQPELEALYDLMPNQTVSIEF